MGLRITTWNVNGIRNPFGYPPWRNDRTFAAMFKILEADIVVMQEAKIQRKDLRDDMVLVPGWDVYFSLPKHKKGYSGVAIYTRNSVCAPIRAEEGITGILAAPNSTTSYRDLPEEQQIGGYPNIEQLGETKLDFTELDSEGRCLILEFPAFVLIGTYCPATRDESRDEFRHTFLNAVDARVRNLVAAGKKVFLTGDLNIIRSEIDTAQIEDRLRKQGMGLEEFFSTPARRMFNHLLVGGKIYGERDENRKKAVLVDLCRNFHPTRKGMYTCWEQRINARPGNFGSRIDYVLCSEDMEDWFSESNIQEGLLGSDHCPVYAVLKDVVSFPGHEVNIRDIMNPDGMFKDGVRLREWSVKDMLPLSAKLIPEFDRRRSIRDMFTKKPSLGTETSSMSGDQGSLTPLQNLETATPVNDGIPTIDTLSEAAPESTFVSPPTPPPAPPSSTSSPSKDAVNANGKRPSSSTPMSRRISRKTSAGRGQPGKNQSSLTGFFKPKTPPVTNGPVNSSLSSATNTDKEDMNNEPINSSQSGLGNLSQQSIPASPSKGDTAPKLDPSEARETWTKLLSKRVVPRCEHNEPCISLLCKKKGMNMGRSFYICPRPLGPSGEKERGTEWRCGTFIWASDAASLSSS